MKIKNKVKLKLRMPFKILLFLLIIGSIFLVKYIKKVNYEKTYEYKLLQLKYSESDVKYLTKNLSDSELNGLLKIKFSNENIKFIKEKYFIFDNLITYVDYYLDNDEEISRDKVVSLVNVHANVDFYEEAKATDTTKDTLMLVNKYNYLDEFYNNETEDIVNVSSNYAYEGNSLRKDVLASYLDLWQSAKQDGIQLILISSYRSYETQNKLWTSRKDSSGEREADNYAARAGYSEHQTGLAFDIGEWADTNDNFELTSGFKWMKENAYKYGFILRYPEGKESITGYKYEPWHYRYVGIEVAKEINKLDITFDEYYEYFINKK